ncbi:hypothetical protein AAHB33_17630 [Paenarthrobacter sp. S56]|uniref:hypothetical protein n=1 Tax=Paenarthrobacter sp. S56 TaxID=3138179 RepID=UPI00321907E4
MDKNKALLFPGKDLWRTDELREAGYNERRIAGLVGEGHLIRLRRGCYIRATTWESQKAAVRARQRIAAHAHGTLTTSSGGLVYSHASAARLHGLFVWNVDHRVHVTQGSPVSAGSHGVDVVAHASTLKTAEIEFVDGMPCTSLLRTVADCCLTMTFRQSLILVDHALRKGVDAGMLWQTCASLAGRNGVRTLRKALEYADARAESPGETLSRELLQRLRLEMPELQVEVDSPEGRHRLDFAWRKRKLALEFDGKTKYFDYAPTDEAIFKERQREKALMELGWKFLRVQWRDLFQEQQFKMRVLRALQDQPLRNGGSR